jgi:hypothetical protein
MLLRPSVMVMVVTTDELRSMRRQLTPAAQVCAWTGVLMSSVGWRAVKAWC